MTDLVRIRLLFADGILREPCVEMAMLSPRTSPRTA